MDLVRGLCSLGYPLCHRFKYAAICDGQQNTGDKAGTDTLVNFVVPDCFDLRQHGKPDAEPLHAGNDTAGLPPESRVVFFAPRAEPWTPANWFLWHYEMRYLATRQCEEPVRVRLLFDVSDSRFNARGRRWLPSLVPPLEFRGTPAGTPWPPEPKLYWKIRRVRPMPRGRVVCMPGNRRDIRELIVMPAERPPAAAVTRSRGWRRWLLRHTGGRGSVASAYS
jgi:hypothetical protein